MTKHKGLGGDRNQCPSCGELFNRTSVFDMHRTGKHGVNRRCMSVAEMEADGMFKANDGFWRGARFAGRALIIPDAEETAL